jgi:hypothetical protein
MIVGREKIELTKNVPDFNKYNLLFLRRGRKFLQTR